MGAKSTRSNEQKQTNFFWLWKDFFVLKLPLGDNARSLVVSFNSKVMEMKNYW